MASVKCAGVNRLDGIVHFIVPSRWQKRMRLYADTIAVSAIGTGRSYSLSGE